MPPYDFMLAGMEFSRRAGLEGLTYGGKINLKTCAGFSIGSREESEKTRRTHQLPHNDESRPPKFADQKGAALETE